MVYVGIDVSKRQLDIAVIGEPAPGGSATWRVANTADGIQALLTRLTAGPLTLVVLEATGAYHQPLLTALIAAALPVALVNPTQVVAFRKVGLGRTKTDREDARLLARLGQTHDQELRRVSPRQPVQARLRELVRLREDLVASQTRLRGQREAATWSDSTLGQELVAEQLALLEAQLDRVSRAIEHLLATLPEAGALRRLPGVGTWTIAAVLGEVPTALWGDAKRAAAYLGVQPVLHQSGGTSHSRMSKAGPGHVRRVLYMAAVVAIQHDPELRERYAHFVARGKPTMVALGAIMHAILRRMMGVLKTIDPHQEPGRPALAT